MPSSEREKQLQDPLENACRYKQTYFYMVAFESSSPILSRWLTHGPDLMVFLFVYNFMSSDFHANWWARVESNRRLLMDMSYDVCLYAVRLIADDSFNRIIIFSSFPVYLLQRTFHLEWKLHNFHWIVFANICWSRYSDGIFFFEFWSSFPLRFESKGSQAL